MIQPRDRAPLRPLPARRRAARALVLLAGAVLAGCSTGPTAAPPTPSLAVPTAAATPGPTGDPVASSSPVPSPGETGPTAAECTAADIKVSHGLVEGTAGARNTEVVVVSAIPCAVAAWPAFGIRDARGQALIAGASEGPGFVTLFPNAAYTSEVRVANWCGLDPAFPLTLELRLGAEGVAVTGGSFPDEGDMPPCTADATPMLTATSWVASP